MKTPRDIILEHHRAAEVKLQTITAQQLAQLAAGAQNRATPKAARNNSFFITLWVEAILPWRKAWLGLGTAWVLILVSNAILREDSSRIALQSIHAPTPETLQILTEQRRILAQLMETTEPQPPADIPRKPGPRSEVVTRRAIV
jgi:hypothetical protein